MSLPVFDPDRHDLGIDGVGFMLSRVNDEVAPVALQELDAEPATARNAVGEGTNENFTLSSFFFQNDIEGGVGQLKIGSGDRILSEIAQSNIQGHVFPPKAVLTTGSVGGGTNGYFRESSTLYGILSTTVENVASGAATSPGIGSLVPKPGQKVKTSASGASFWVTTDNTLVKKLPGGAISNLTSLLPAGATPYLTELYQRFLWVIASRTLPAASGIEQVISGDLTNTKVITAALPNRPQARNVLVLVIFTNASSFSAELTMISEGWTERETEEISSPAAGQMFVFTKANPTAEDRVVRWEWNVATIESAYHVFEVDGIDPDAPFMDSAFAEYAGGTAVGSRPSGTVNPDSGLNLYVGYMTGTTPTKATPTNYTIVGTPANDNFSTYAFFRPDTTDTSVTSNTSATTPAEMSVLLKLRSNAITDDLAQTVFIYSENDGATWEEAFNGDSGGMPPPVSTLAVQGSMFITTEYGLYEMRSEDQLSGGQTYVLNAVRGSMDDFHYPLDAAYIGNAMAAFDGSVYYNLGSTMRRFPPGGRAEQIWPPRGWSQGGGNVIAMTSGEAGVWFGTDDGFLWLYDGRGFHQMAKATEQQLAQLHWHGGKLYLSGDPAPYFQYDYPSLRPDVPQPGPATYTTGYMISSIITMERVGDIKIARRFETQAEFSDDVTSGTYRLQYLIGDSGFHPDRLSPDDATLPWVTIGDHTVTDGNTKTHIVDPPIQFERLYLRAVLIPGATGIPIWEGWGIDGEALMHRRVRYAAQLSLSVTDTKDRKNNHLYPTEDVLALAISKLKSLRDKDHLDYTPYFEVIFRETGDVEVEKLCIGEKLDFWLESHQGTDGLFSHAGASLVLRELP